MCSTMLGLAVLAVAASSDDPLPTAESAVILLTDGPVGAAAATAGAVQDYVRYLRIHAPGSRVLTAEQVSQRLVGAAHPRDPKLDALSALLVDARGREARFDTAAANDMRRDILDAFARAPYTSGPLRAVAAAAAQDIAAAWLGEGRAAQAAEAAAEAVRRFGDAPVNPIVHAPKVHLLFADAARAIASEATGRLEVFSDRAGHLYLDGRYLGRTRGTLGVRVVPGRYRLWLVSEEGTTLGYPVHVRANATTHVTVRAVLDRKLRVEPTPTLVCSATCPADLAELAERLAVGRIHGLRARSDNPQARRHEVLTLEVRPDSKTTVTTTRFARSDAPEIVAVLPAVPVAGAPPWIGYLAADILTRALLVRPSPATPPAPPPGVVTWQQVSALAERLGVDRTRPLRPADVQRLTEASRTSILVSGGYALDAGILTLRWQLHGSRSAQQTVIVALPEAEEGMRLGEVANPVLAELGVDPRRGNRCGAASLSLAASRSYGKALQLLGHAPLRPRPRGPRARSGVSVSPSLISQQDLEAARRLLEQVTDAAPGFQPAWSGRGLVSALQGDVARAEQQLARGLMLAGEVDPSLAMGLHYYYRNTGSKQDARRILADVVAGYPGFLLGYELLDRD